MIQVLYFAAIREEVGTQQEAVAPEAAATVGELLDYLRSLGGGRERALAAERRVLAAVNQEHAPAECALSDGDEVAFFPPVTGGAPGSHDLV